MMTTEQSTTVSQHDILEEYKKILRLKIEGTISGDFFHNYISRAHVREALGLPIPDQQQSPLMKQIASSNLCCEISLPSSEESWTQIGRDNIPVSELPIGAIL